MSHSNSCLPGQRGALRSTIVVVTVSLFVGGCNGSSTIEMRQVCGSVRYGDEKVEEGIVRFVPIENTRGPTSLGQIVNGRYEILARGGVPLGKHRVEVDAWKFTQETISTRGRFETVQEPKKLRLGPADFGGEQSPLRCEVTSAFDGRYDIDLPLANP